MVLGDPESLLKWRNFFGFWEGEEEECPFPFSVLSCIGESGHWKQMSHDSSADDVFNPHSPNDHEESDPEMETGGG